MMTWKEGGVSDFDYAWWHREMEGFGLQKRSNFDYVVYVQPLIDKYIVF